MAVFNKTIIPFALVGYEMIIANSRAHGIIANYKYTVNFERLQVCGKIS